MSWLTRLRNTVRNGLQKEFLNDFEFGRIFYSISNGILNNFGKIRHNREKNEGAKQTQNWNRYASDYFATALPTSFRISKELFEKFRLFTEESKFRISLQRRFAGIIKMKKNET